MISMPDASRCYGFDIETDTTVDGLDAARSSIVAVAVAHQDRNWVLQCEEGDLLKQLDEYLASLAPGLLITWNGSGFDLPFIEERARRLGLNLGLRRQGAARGRVSPGNASLASQAQAVSWWSHRHLDGYRLYRADLGRMWGLSCALKPLSRMIGLSPVEVDRERIHTLSRRDLNDYVASDARVARELVMLRMPQAQGWVDRVAAPSGVANQPAPG